MGTLRINRVGRVRLRNADGALFVKRPVTSNWERIVISGDITGESEYVRCCVEIPAACAVDVYGPQLESARSVRIGIPQKHGLGGCLYRSLRSRHVRMRVKRPRQSRCSSAGCDRQNNNFMTIHEIKRSEITQTPLLLFECELPTGAVERWSTHEIQLGDRSFDGGCLGTMFLICGLRPRTGLTRYRRFLLRSGMPTRISHKLNVQRVGRVRA